MGLTALSEKKNIHRQNQIKPCCLLVTIHWGLKKRNDRSVQENEQYLCFFLPLITVLSAFTTAGVRCVIFFLLYGRSQTYKCITTTYLSNGSLTLYLQSQLGVSMIQDSWTVQLIRGKKKNINTVLFLAQTDRFVSIDLNVSSRAARFNLALSVYVFFLYLFINKRNWLLEINPWRTFFLDELDGLILLSNFMLMNHIRPGSFLHHVLEWFR